MLRTITLSLLMLVSIGVMLPLASSTAHGIRQSVEAQQRHHYRRHSRAWWRRYRARLRRRRAAAMAHRNRPLSQMMPNNAPGAAASLAPLPNLPATVGSAEAKSGSARSVVPGQTSFSVVALSRPNPGYLTSREQSRMLSGVAFSDLRRIVIDKMVATGGWVINDYEREITGHRVFVVTAQTPSDGRSPEKSWNFYFTEVNGRIYSLTTNTSAQFAGLMAAEAERLVGSLYTGGNSAGVKASR
jgi:hypothetical protein